MPETAASPSVEPRRWWPHFGKGGDTDETLRLWHASLTTGSRDTAGRAALRRAASLDDILLDAAAPLERLRRRLVGSATLSDFDLEALARVAATTAEIEQDSAQTGLGACFAAYGMNPDRPVVSIERMTLLLATEEPELFVRLLRGLMPLVGRSAPVIGTADIVWGWHFGLSRERARRRLMRDYIQAVPARALSEEKR